MKDGAGYGHGLSPRVRGNPPSNHPEMNPHGSIPACAGKPLRSRGRFLMRGVYPRVCGETTFVDYLNDVAEGLSPRVRGNPVPPETAVFPSGSIPACAGKPTANRNASCNSWVYPRVCGETKATAGGKRSVQGLSPRVRGNLLHDLRKVRTNGSIPACAGKPP